MSHQHEADEEPQGPFAQITFPIRQPQDVEELFGEGELSREYQALLEALLPIEDVRGVGIRCGYRKRSCRASARRLQTKDANRFSR